MNNTIGEVKPIDHSNDIKLKWFKTKLDAYKSEFKKIREFNINNNSSNDVMWIMDLSHQEALEMKTYFHSAIKKCFVSLTIEEINTIVSIPQGTSYDSQSFNSNGRSLCISYQGLKNYCERALTNDSPKSNWKQIMLRKLEDDIKPAEMNSKPVRTCLVM